VTDTTGVYIDEKSHPSPSFPLQKWYFLPHWRCNGKQSCSWFTCLVCFIVAIYPVSFIITPFLMFIFRLSYLTWQLICLCQIYPMSQNCGPQRKTALKYGVNRRQIQKWLAQESSLRSGLGVGGGRCSRDDDDEEEEEELPAPEGGLGLYQRVYQHKASQKSLPSI
jgi:hypothetical protein